MAKRSIAVLTHHKCGSTWLFWMLQTVLKQNNMDWFASHLGQAVPALDRSVSMLQNSQYEVVRHHLADVNVHFIRNPLSVLVSAYYSHLSSHGLEQWPRLRQQRQLLSSVSYQSGLFLTAAFLGSSTFAQATSGPFAGLKEWDYEDRRITTIRMEDAAPDPAAFLNLFRGISGLDELTLPETDHFRFETFTGRKVGEIDPTSHYRSGDPDGWRRELPSSVIDYMREEFREVLTRFYPEALSDAPETNQAALEGAA